MFVFLIINMQYTNWCGDEGGDWSGPGNYSPPIKPLHIIIAVGLAAATMTTLLYFYKKYPLEEERLKNDIRGLEKKIESYIFSQ